MISYKRFWDTLNNSKETTYTLVQKHHLSSSTLDKLRKDRPLNTKTIDRLCSILQCKVEEIMEYIPSETGQEGE
ncbi:MAG: helix-turn-helix domain-containing protein [Ruminococcus sp.]|jgi:putative transcriptional regulator